jgi:hypothetical protein
MCLFGTDNDSSISGIWVWRGQDLAFEVSSLNRIIVKCKCCWSAGDVLHVDIHISWCDQEHVFKIYQFALAMNKCSHTQCSLSWPSTHNQETANGNCSISSSTVSERQLLHCVPLISHIVLLYVGNSRLYSLVMTKIKIFHLLLKHEHCLCLYILLLWSYVRQRQVWEMQHSYNIVLRMQSSGIAQWHSVIHQKTRILGLLSLCCWFWRLWLQWSSTYLLNSLLYVGPVSLKF